MAVPPDTHRFSRSRAAIDRLAALVQRAQPERIVVAGGPCSGKSTLVSKLSDGRCRVHGGEELVGREWSAGSLEASGWLDKPGPWICENVAMARALRKWLARNLGKAVPADLIIHLGCQVADRSPGQSAMAKGCQTVWEQIKPELMRRGARILETNPQTVA